MDVIEKRANTDLNVRAVGPLRGRKLETRARFMRQCVPPTSNRGACPTREFVHVDLMGKRYGVREDLTSGGPGNCPKARQICACPDPIRRSANGMGQWDCSLLHAQAIPSSWPKNLDGYWSALGETITISSTRRAGSDRKSTRLNSSH